MTSRLAAVAVLVLLGAALDAQRPPSYTFDADTPGKLPSGFVTAAFRQESPGGWTIARAGSKGMLNHPAEAGRAGWSLAIAPGTAMRDLIVAVRVRLSGGARAGGVVWHYQNAENFNAVVLDLARHEITAYRVVGGNRITFDTEDDLELDVDAWHTVKVTQEGSEVAVSLGGIRVFHDRERRDARLREGLAGVIATGHSEAAFDDLRIEPRHNGNARSSR